MTTFQRFDLEGSPELSERELKRRWSQFHDAIRLRYFDKTHDFSIELQRLVELIDPQLDMLEAECF